MQVPMNTFLHKIALVALVLSPLPTPISANKLDDNLQVILRPGWRATDGTHIAALQITLAPGWKTYWRQPGRRVTFKISSNSSAEIGVGSGDKTSATRAILCRNVFIGTCIA